MRNKSFRKINFLWFQCGTMFLHMEKTGQNFSVLLDILLSRMEECNLKEEDYWWYVNLRRYGGTKHAGYGLGFERIIMYLTGVSNIRDVIPYPRTVGNAEY